MFRLRRFESIQIMIFPLKKLEVSPTALENYPNYTFLPLKMLGFSCSAPKVY